MPCISPTALPAPGSKSCLTSPYSQVSSSGSPPDDHDDDYIDDDDEDDGDDDHDGHYGDDTLKLLQARHQSSQRSSSITIALCQFSNKKEKGSPLILSPSLMCSSSSPDYCSPRRMKLRIFHL